MRSVPPFFAGARGLLRLRNRLQRHQRAASESRARALLSPSAPSLLLCLLLCLLLGRLRLRASLQRRRPPERPSSFGRWLTERTSLVS